MKKKGKRSLSFFLAFLMVLTSLTVGLTAFAADDGTASSGSSSSQSETVKEDSSSSASSEKTTSAKKTTLPSASDADYKALASAMSSKYVQTLSNYAVGSQFVIATDNAAGEIATAAAAYAKVFSEEALTMVYEVTNQYMAERIASKLAKVMGDDYNSKIESVITVCFSGMGTAEAVNYNSGEFSFTVESPYMSELTSYSSVQDLPEEITKGSEMTYEIKGSNYVVQQRVYLASYSDLVPDIDAATTNALKYFDSTLLASIAGTGLSKLSADQLKKLLNNGNAWLENLAADVSITSEELDTVLTAYYGRTYAGFESYMEKVFTESLIRATNQVSAAIAGKTSDYDFSLEELESLKELIDNAQAVYDKANDSQKKAIKDYYAILKAQIKFYDAAYNTYLKNQYKAAIAKLNGPYVSNDYTIKSSDLDDLAAILEEAETAYEAYTGEMDSDMEGWHVIYQIVEKKYLDAAYTYSVSNFSESAKSLYYDYGNRSIDVSEKEDIEAAIAAVEALYEALPEEFLLQDDVQSGAFLLAEVKASWQSAQEKDVYTQFISLCKSKLKSYYKDADGSISTSNDITVVKVTNSNVDAIGSVITKLDALYDEMVSPYTSYPDVTYYRVAIEKLRDKVNDVRGNYSFEAYDVEYPDGITEKDVQAIIDSIDDVIVGEVGGTVMQALIDEFTGSNLFDLLDASLNDILTGQNGSDIINWLMSLLYPLVQDGFKDFSLEDVLDMAGYGDYVGIIAGIVDIDDYSLWDCMNEEEGGLSLMGMFTLYVGGLCADPNSIPNTTLFNSDYKYQVIAKEIAKAGQDWDAVNWDAIDWQIETIEDFVNCLAVALSGIDKIVSSMVQNIGLYLNVDAVVLGEQLMEGWMDAGMAHAGWENDLLPFMEMLGCSGQFIPSDEYGFTGTWNPDMPLADSQTLQAYSLGDDGYIEAGFTAALKNVIYPLLQWIGDLCEDGGIIDALLSFLPTLSYLIETNMFQDGVTDLLSLLTDDFGLDMQSIIDMTGRDELTDMIGDLLDGLGFDADAFNWSELAGIGTWTTISSSTLSGSVHYIDASAADVLVYILYYAYDLMDGNQAALSDMIGDNDTVNEILDYLFAQDKETFVSALVTMMTPSYTKDYNWSKQLSSSKTNVSYSKYSKSEVNNFINVLDSVVDTLVADMLNGGIDAFLVDNALDGKMATDILNAVWGAIEGIDEDTMSLILSLVTITDANGKVSTLDLSKDALAKAMKSYGFSGVAKALNSSKTISDAKIKSSTWKIKTSEDFVNALCAMLAPFGNVLACLFAGQDMQVSIAGIFTIDGANGYNNAALPLLNALGCDAMSSAKYEKAVAKDSSKALYYIVEPIVDMVCGLDTGAVSSVIDMLPGLANYLGNGGLQTSIEQLLAPFDNILAAVSMYIDDDSVYSFLVDEFLDDLLDYDFSWDNLQNELVSYVNDNLLNSIKINGKKYSFTLPAIKWSKFAGCVDSKGNASTSDTAVTFLKYIWDILEANESQVKKLAKDLLGADTYKSVKKYINNLFDLSSSEAVAMVVGLVSGLDASSFKADWSFLYKGYKKTSVSYPEGMKSGDLDALIDDLSTAIINGLELFDFSLTDLVNDNLYTDSMVTTIAKAIFGLYDNSTVKTILDLFDIDVSKNAVYKSLKSDYSSVAKSIKNAKSFSKVDTSKWSWGVKDKESFAKAITAILRPFEDILGVLLNSGTVNIAGYVDFTGSNGYANAIKPALDALGCDTVSASKYAKDIKKNSDYVLLDILNPLLDLVDDILQDPLGGIMDAVPSLANFIDKGGVQYFLECLLYPIVNIVDPLTCIILDDGDSVYDFLLDLVGIDASWDNLQNKLIPMVNDTSLLKDIKIGDNKYSFTIPNIDWSKMGGCGKVSGKTIKANRADEIMVLMRYLFKVVDYNEAAIMQLVGGADSTVGEIVGNVIDCGADGIVKIFVDIFETMETAEDGSWTFKDVESLETTYTPNYDGDYYDDAMDAFDEMIAELLDEFLGMSIPSLISDNVYTNSIINTVAKLIYPNLAGIDIGIDMNTILGIFDIDISTKAVANDLSDFASASAEIAAHSDWADVDFSAIDWGVTDRDSFVSALAAILRPFDSLLAVILSGDDLVLLDSITIKGGNGYNTALVPLAEAIGVPDSSLVSVATYTSNSGTDLLITGLVDPILDWVDELAAAPIRTLCDMLPNLAYFIYNGGLYDMAMNLIEPVTNILEEVDPIYSLDVGQYISFLEDIDLDGLVNSILPSIEIAGAPLNIQLLDIDLAQLAGRGELVTYTSVRTENGTPMVCQRIEADDAAVFISVLRYLFETIKANMDEINELLAMLDLGDYAAMVDEILDALVGGDIDETIELLMDLLFGSGEGGAAASDTELAASSNVRTPAELQNEMWIYWTFFAAIVVLVGICLALILSSKKKEKGVAEAPAEGSGDNPEKPE